MKRFAVALIGAVAFTVFVGILFKVMVGATDYNFKGIAAIIFIMLFGAIYMLFKPRSEWEEDQDNRPLDDGPLSDMDR